MYKKIFLYVFTAMIIALGASCSLSRNNHNPVKNPPTNNPHPQYYFNIKTQVDPKIEQPIKLTLQARYVTSNPNCQNLTHWFEGVKEDQAITIEKTVTLPHNQVMYYKIPLDKFLPGYCQWRVERVAYQLHYPQAPEYLHLRDSYTSLFSQNAKITGNTRLNAWRCTDICNLYKQRRSTVAYYLNDKQSYYDTLQFISGSKHA